MPFAAPQATEDIAAAHHDGDLGPGVDRLFHVARQAIDHRHVETVAAPAHQRLARQLHEEPLVDETLTLAAIAKPFRLDRRTVRHSLCKNRPVG